MSQLTTKITTRIAELVQKGELSNKDLCSIIENCGSFLNLRTISQYGQDEGITYNAVLKRIESNKIHTITIFNIKFVIDNE